MQNTQYAGPLEGWVQNSFGGWTFEGNGYKLYIGQSPKKFWNVWINNDRHQVAFKAGPAGRNEAMAYAHENAAPTE